MKKFQLEMAYWASLADFLDVRASRATENAGMASSQTVSSNAYGKAQAFGEAAEDIRQSMKNLAKQKGFPESCLDALLSPLPSEAQEIIRSI